MLGVVRVDVRKCEPLLLDIYLPCDVYILGGFSWYFLGFFLVGFSLFRLGAARAPILLDSVLAFVKVNIFSKKAKL